MDAKALLQASGAADAVTVGGVLLLFYPYAPYLPCEGILPLDSYYIACHQAYQKASKLGLPFANHVRIKPLLTQCGMQAGRCTLALHPQFGSYFLVQAMQPSASTPKFTKNFAPLSCANCNACRTACPGGAIGNAAEDFVRQACLRDQMDRSLTLASCTALGESLLGCEVCRKVCPHNAGVHPAAMPEGLLGLLTLEVLLQFAPQTKAALSALIGCNMARASILLPQAMAAALRQKRHDLLPMLLPLATHPSARVADSARICISLLKN